MSQTEKTNSRTVDPKEFRKLLLEGWISPDQMAKRWGIKVMTIFVLMKQGKIKYVKTVDGRFRLLDPTQGRP